ncbi:MAG: N-acetylmuramoyl-L-alanine amidase [Desulfobacterales bacterium]|nr:N-acetylmuramoyl-L-alanine amidase [Desulfobacterales bacterium]
MKRFLFLPVVLLFALFGNEALCREISSAGGSTGQKVVVLDPGHGGRDLGAEGTSGLAEKTVTFALAQKIKEILSGTYDVHLTRNGDYTLEIEKRTAVANHRRADIFISLHAAASFQHKARGMAIFYCGPDTTHGSTHTGQGEQMAEHGEKLHPWDHIQSVHSEKSQFLANLVHRQLVAKFNPLHKRIREAPCLVLRGADMPAILVELAYLSHPAEEKELADPGVISNLAAAIGEGISDFFTQGRGCIKKEGVIMEEDITTGRGAVW